MSAGAQLGNFTVDRKEWEGRVASVEDGSYISTNICSKGPWFVPEKSAGITIGNFIKSNLCA